MKIVFISNIFNHHQKFLSDYLYSLCSHHYHFIATEEMTSELRILGYNEYKDIPYLINSYESIDSNVLQIVNDADVVIIGSAKDEWIKERIKNKKLVFRYVERPLKNGLELWKYPYRWIKWHIENPWRAPIYLLCASAYAAGDFKKFGLFNNRCYKWGYFPEAKFYQNLEDLMSYKDKREILWCGRFLDWKHPDDVLKVAKELKKNGYHFHIKIIGTGKMAEVLTNMCDQMALNDCISFLGSMSPQLVRKNMEHAGIFLLTSDQKEGWGTVLNEAMNSGCAVVANEAAGATPYLICHQQNGLVYSCGSIDELYNDIVYLLCNQKEQDILGKNAYKTIQEKWNADIAAQRLVELSEQILHNGMVTNCFSDGPCSKA